MPIDRQPSHLLRLTVLTGLLLPTASLPVEEQSDDSLVSVNRDHNLRPLDAEDPVVAVLSIQSSSQRKRPVSGEGQLDERKNLVSHTTSSEVAAQPAAQPAVLENVQTNVGVEEADTAEDKNRDKVACTSDGALKAADCATAFADSVMSAVKSAGTDKGKLCSQLSSAFSTYKGCFDSLDAACVDSAMKTHFEASKTQMAGFGCEIGASSNGGATAPSMTMPPDFGKKMDDALKSPEFKKTLDDVMKKELQNSAASHVSMVGTAANCLLGMVLMAALTMQ